MPKKKTAFKELRKAKLRHHRNVSTSSELKTLIKKFEKSISGKKTEEAKGLINTLISKLNRAASKGIIHRNAASRKISRLMKKFSSLAKA